MLQLFTYDCCHVPAQAPSAYLLPFPHPTFFRSTSGWARYATGGRRMTRVCFFVIARFHLQRTPGLFRTYPRCSRIPRHTRVPTNSVRGRWLCD